MAVRKKHPKKAVTHGRVRPNRRAGLGGETPGTATFNQPKDPPPGEIGIYLPERQLAFTLPLNEAGATPVSGGPRYTVSERLQRRGVPEWTGHDPMRMTVAVLLDRYEDDESVLPDIGLIDQMSVPVGQGRKMPDVFISGAVPYRNLAWLMDGYPDWDTDPEPIRNYDGDLVRQPLTIKLVERPPSEILTASDMQLPNAKGKRKRIHVVKGNENDFSDVSQHEYGNRDQAAALARFNGLPTFVRLTKGMKIKLVP